MNKLDKVYEALDILQSLEIPISSEQRSIIKNLEKDYLREEVMPLFEQELEHHVEKLINRFNLEVSYTKEDGLEISLIERPRVVMQTLFEDKRPSKRQKKYIIRVQFPDNHVSCNQHVWETLVDVVRYAGPERVQGLNITIMGGNLVSKELFENERYRVGQKEVEPGLYVCTYSSTDTKYEQIKEINRRLNLGLQIAKQML